MVFGTLSVELKLDKACQYLRTIGESFSRSAVIARWNSVYPVFQHLDFTNPNDETCKRLAETLQMPEMGIIESRSATRFRAQAWFKKVVRFVGTSNAQGSDPTEHFMKRWVVWNRHKLFDKDVPSLIGKLEAIEQGEKFAESDRLQENWLSIVHNDFKVPSDFAIYHFYLRTGLVCSKLRLKKLRSRSGQTRREISDEE